MVGLTGVVWFPRGAPRMSTELYAGPGPVPLAGASAGWTGMTEALGDVAGVVGAVIAELGVTWQGAAGDTALAGLVRFEAWLAVTIEHTARAAALTGTGAGAYTAAALVMPSPVEIAATAATVATATAASAAAGPAALAAGAATAEAAQRELDIRATLAMEGYEAASVPLSIVEPFAPPPPIGHADAAEASAAVRAVAGGDDAVVRAASLGGTTGPTGPAAGAATGSGPSAAPAGVGAGGAVPGVAAGTGGLRTVAAGLSGPAGAGAGGIGGAGSIAAGIGGVGAAAGGVALRAVAAAPAAASTGARPASTASGVGAVGSGLGPRGGFVPATALGARDGHGGEPDVHRSAADRTGAAQMFDDDRVLAPAVLGVIPGPR